MQQVLDEFNKERGSAVYMLYLSSGHFYIGKSWNISDRYKNHCHLLQKGAHHNKVMARVYKDNNNELQKIKTIEFSHEDLLYKRESEIIEVYKKDEKCINLNGGTSRKRISTRHVNKTNPKRKISINLLTKTEFKTIIERYGSIDHALLRLLELDK